MQPMDQDLGNSDSATKPMAWTRAGTAFINGVE
jgi:hypothetical protein